MMTPVKGLILFLMIDFLPASFEDKHSLLYLYTMQSKNYDCTAETLLNDRQIDFYNSADVSRTAKQNWLKNISESDWKTSTEKLQYDTQLLNRLLDVQMSEFGHSNSGVHVLQWRHGCEGEQSSDGSLTVLNSINEFGYDGEDLIQFNCKSKTWITPEKNREREEEKNREREEKWSKLYHADKKCEHCEEMLKMYLKYKTTDITQSNTPAAVHIFAKKSVRDSRNLILICLITGFYPKDVKMSLRKFGTSFPDHLITSSGVRPNDDGTYQLRKSVEIQEDEKAKYDCYVTHSSLTEPVIKQWDDFPNKISLGLFIGVAVSLIVLVLLPWSVNLCVWKWKIIKRPTNWRSRGTSHSARSYKDGRSWVLIVGGAVSGVAVLLCFVIPCILLTMIIKNERSLDIMIGVLVLGGLLSLCSVIPCFLMMMIKSH